jgi:glycosyltransferase involved in cell wall biosynthesis
VPDAARQPAVSVVVPLYDSGAHIVPTLETLRAQTFEDWECVLVNDGSTDDTADRVRPFLADARFRYVERPNGGVAAARNTGIRASSGRWVALLDHDDRWLPTKLEAQVVLAERGFDVVCTDAEMIGAGDRRRHSSMFAPALLAQVQRDRWQPGTDVLGLLLQGNFICTSSVLVERSLLERGGLFDPEMSSVDDYDLWLRLAPAARIGYVPEALVEYRIHESNFSHDGVWMAQQAVTALERARRRHLDRSREFERTLALVYSQLLWALLKRGRHREAVAALTGLARAGAHGARVGAAAVALLVRGVATRKAQRAFARVTAVPPAAP